MELPRPLDQGKNSLPSPEGDQSEYIPQFDPSQNVSDASVTDTSGIGEQDSQDQTEIIDTLKAIHELVQGISDKLNVSGEDSTQDEAGTGRAPSDPADETDIKDELKRLADAQEKLADRFDD